ncbi:erythroferrone-like [Pelobates fuscus]|uniref:erythroferrone-like n=1 Tax=Pelobates fuscus TaxID=191477 RepID=UPI002FE44479
MDMEYKPIPLRCLLMTLSMGVLLILLCAGPACTHKNRGSKFQEAPGTELPFQDTPAPTSPYPYHTTLKQSTQMVPVLKRPYWDPREAWLLLLRKDRVDRIKKKGHKDHHHHHRPGPIGPPAPPQHHNHLSNAVPHEKILHVFIQMLKDILKSKNGKNTPGHGNHLMVNAAFTCMTDQDASVEPGNQIELQLYHQPNIEGSFNIGDGFNLTSGRYTAPISGLYTFSARLKIVQETKKNTHGFFQVQLCIQSLCQKNLSLQKISSLSLTGPHTISLNGVLHLQAGQYVSLFLENHMEYWLVVEKGSDFSGVLLHRGPQ